MVTPLHRAEPKFRALVICQYFEPGFRGGGPVRSIAQIVDTISEDVALCVVTRDHDAGDSARYRGLSGRWIPRGRSSIFYLNLGNPKQIVQLAQELRRTSFDLLYLNSIWAPGFTVVPLLASRFRLIRIGSVLLAPRGELSPGALSLKSRKKSIFLRCFPFLVRGLKIVWHASTPLEASEIRSVFPDADVQIVLNQVALAAAPVPVKATRQGPVRFVFISRITPKKNLMLALRALAGLQSSAALHIYGPVDDANYWAQCKAVMTEIPQHIQVEYRGLLRPSQVPLIFAQYDAFVFPTLGENFGHVIAESLFASCPVISSDQTPWTEILLAGGGSVLADLTVGSLRRELERRAVMPPEERAGARTAAAAAYVSWSANRTNVNVLDQVLLARTAV